MVTAAQTYEGENTVMFLQTARYLIKAWNQALNGEKLPPTVKYLELYAKNKKVNDKFENSSRGILRAFQTAAAKKVSFVFNFKMCEL